MLIDPMHLRPVGYRLTKFSQQLQGIEEFHSRPSQPLDVVFLHGTTDKPERYLWGGPTFGPKMIDVNGLCTGGAHQLGDTFECAFVYVWP